MGVLICLRESGLVGMGAVALYDSTTTTTHHTHTNTVYVLVCALPYYPPLVFIRFTRRRCIINLAQYQTYVCQYIPGHLLQWCALTQNC